MADNAVTHSATPGVPAPPPDAENEAIIDARKTFVATVITFVLFAGAALVIILGFGM